MLHSRATISGVSLDFGFGSGMETFGFGCGTVRDRLAGPFEMLHSLATISGVSLDFGFGSGMEAFGFDSGMEGAFG